MSDVDDIKAKLDLVGYIEQSGTPLKKAGRYYRACCPFHRESTPSFFVDADKQTWRCYGSCATGGDLFAFAQKQHNWTFPEALEELAKVAGVELKRRESGTKAEQLDRLRGLMQAAADSYNRLLREWDKAAEVRAYVERRGLTAETVEQFQIGYAPRVGIRSHLEKLGYTEADMLAAGVLKMDDVRGVVETMRDRLIIPIRDERGRVIAFGGRAMRDDQQPKYLNTPVTPLFSKSHTLFALDTAKRVVRDKTVVVVEGYMDAISAHQAGFANVVAQMGTALTEHQLKLLLKERTRTIVLALDGDAAGQAAARRGLEQVMVVSADIRVATMPDGDDPDDVIRRDPDHWTALIDGAVPLADYVIAHDTATLPPNAPFAVRERLARELLPILMAAESDLYRMNNVQKLALALGLPERELMALAKVPVKAPESVTTVTRPKAPIEAYCLRAFIHETDWFYQTERAFNEMGLSAFGVDDFPVMGATFALFLEALDQFDEDVSVYVAARTDVPTGSEPLFFDAVLFHAFRLRLARVQAELEQLAMLGDGEALKVRHRERWDINQHMKELVKKVI